METQSADRTPEADDAVKEAATIENPPEASPTAPAGPGATSQAATHAFADGGPAPTPLPGYPCEASNSCRCEDFAVHPEAQRIFNQHGGHNWSGLDPDGDGSLCEWLP